MSAGTSPGCSSPTLASRSRQSTHSFPLGLSRKNVTSSRDATNSRPASLGKVSMPAPNRILYAYYRSKPGNPQPYLAHFLKFFSFFSKVDRVYCKSSEAAYNFAGFAVIVTRPQSLGPGFLRRETQFCWSCHRSEILSTSVCGRQ